MALKSMRTAFVCVCVRARLNATSFLIGFMCGDIFIDSLRFISGSFFSTFGLIVVVVVVVVAFVICTRNECLNALVTEYGTSEKRDQRTKAATKH